PVDVLLELPAEPRLADAGDPADEQDLGSLLVRGAVEQLLDEPQLPLAPDERRFESARTARTLRARDHAKGTPEGYGLGLSLQYVLAGVVIGDRGLRRAPGRLSDEHGAGLRCALDRRGG